ncbi:ALF repeat-containing protein, partial [Streptomyces rimosus]|uniref:ALF repeat-containing protein n=1 Tax=Streptomyces rimosus TaxID=1927 RepID=UPI0033D8EF2B
MAAFGRLPRGCHGPTIGGWADERLRVVQIMSAGGPATKEAADVALQGTAQDA